MITLTSDFGFRDPYVAEMKAAILSINLDAKIIDVTHNVEQFNIRMGAFILASVVPYFPKDTVHLAVIDPDVGTERRAIIVQTKDNLFVGPDNGVLTLAAQKQNIQHIYQLTNPKLMLPKVSSTFHGRDIFAPAAAYLDKGVAPQEFGPEIFDPILPNFIHVKKARNELLGEILYIDNFGNVITNIPGHELETATTIRLKISTELFTFPFGKTYANACAGEPVILIGSHGFLEIALNQEKFSERFKIKVGDSIEVLPT